MYMLLVISHSKCLSNFLTVRLAIDIPVHSSIRKILAVMISLW